jgi:hypothetical protein
MIKNAIKFVIQETVKFEIFYVCMYVVKLFISVLYK